MSGMRDLPEQVFKFLERGVVSEFATVSTAGVPIDTPTYYYPSEDMATIDVSTSLTAPTKAERARRNPKVGLLMEGAAHEPVVTVRGMAAVRDSDLRANAIRYLAETGFKGISYGLPWEGARKAVWYWTRCLIEITPECILWWDNPAAMDGPPKVWKAPADTVYPQSDPEPAGKTTRAPDHPQRTWQEKAREALARGAVGHLTLCDDDGYPLPMPARRLELAGDGFLMSIPRGAPWRGTGKATLTFEGQETFVGYAAADGGSTHLKVERALPELVTMKDPRNVLQPGPELRAEKMARLQAEVGRRGQPIPALPDEPPPLTRMAMLRQERLASAVPITGLTDARGNRSA